MTEPEGGIGRDANSRRPVSRQKQIRRGGNIVHGRADPLRVVPAILGQLYAATFAEEELSSEVFLQCGYLPAYGGLRHPHLLGGATEAARTGGDMEDMQGVEGRHFRH